MKFVILFGLALATASAFDLRDSNIESGSVAVPISATKGRITNGNTAAVGQFPYQVGLYIEGYWCGGCLIGNNWVVTAAHCTKGKEEITVHLGATERYSPNVTYTVNRSAIINHARYNSSTFANDISLIRIPYTFFNTWINKVNLPAIASSYPDYAGSNAIASGWGRTSTGRTNNLQWALQPVITNDECARTFGIVTSSIICTDTSSGVSTCRGDSGGPLVSESLQILIGVTSFVDEGGCELGSPNGFTRVTSYLNWIKCKTGIAY